jgi:3',5'-cyclic AMP phosphodiesterase CpdA
MFTLAHLSDPHIGPLQRPTLRELMSKRMTGYVNWRRSRKLAHDMELLAALVADMKAQHPDHVACTGDIANIGLASEWPSAAAFLAGIGAPNLVSFVPGNHDAYVRGALEGMQHHCAPWMAGDETGIKAFPFIRRCGFVALVGLSSAVPTAPFMASGTLGEAQLKAAEEFLTRLAGEGYCRVIMIHHPPHRKGAQLGRHLTDAAAFEAMIARVGADLILHGHNHTTSLAFMQGPQGKIIPVVGAPSASSRGNVLTHRAAYHLFHIRQEHNGFHLDSTTHGLLKDGSIGFIASLPLDRL